MDHPKPSAQMGEQHRQLRVVAIFAFIPALALLLPCGIITARVLPTIGIAPMFFSAASQVMTLGGTPRLPKTTVCINLLIAAFLFSILVPSWIQMGDGSLSYRHGAGLTMLGTYGTMPLLVNFWIHLYLALRAIMDAWRRTSVSGCCCNSPGGCLRSHRTETSASKKDGIQVYQPIMSFYDDDARPSSEFRTSGCNTPRVSQETLEGSSRESEDLV